MRVHINAHIPIHLHREFPCLPLILTIETAQGGPGRCEHRTTTAELLWTLDKKSGIQSSLLEGFCNKLRQIEDATLRDVELSDDVLDGFGFFLS